MIPIWVASLLMLVALAVGLACGYFYWLHLWEKSRAEQMRKEIVKEWWPDGATWDQAVKLAEQMAEHRKRVQVNRKSVPREDAGPPARMSRVVFVKGPRHGR